MNLPELYRTVQAALDGERDALALERLARRAAELADLTTWAPGAIDPHGQAVSISLALEAQIRGLYAEHSDPALAELHDALAELRAAILKHDDDLRPRRDEDEYGEY
jgi:hypothetical protein